MNLFREYSSCLGQRAAKYFHTGWTFLAVAFILIGSSDEFLSESDVPCIEGVTRDGTITNVSNQQSMNEKKKISFTDEKSKRLGSSRCLPQTTLSCADPLLHYDMQKYEGSCVHGRNSDMPKNYKQDIVRREEGTTSPYTTPKVLQLVLACTLYSSSSCSTTCRKATYAAKREILYTAYWCQVPRCHGATHHARHARHAVRSMPLCWSDGGRWEDWYR